MRKCSFEEVNRLLNLVQKHNLTCCFEYFLVGKEVPFLSENADLVRVDYYDEDALVISCHGGERIFKIEDFTCSKYVGEVKNDYSRIEILFSTEHLYVRLGSYDIPDHILREAKVKPKTKKELQHS